MNKIKVVLADDHKLVRAGFKALLKKNNDLDVVGEAADGIALLETLENVFPDVVLLDLSMPGMHGMDAISVIRKKFPSMGIIVLTMHEEPEYVMSCIQNGADGYLLKSTEPEELYQAIAKVASSEKYFTPAVSNIFLNNIILSGNDPRAKKILSEREKEVLKFIVEGRSAKAIGDVLFISARTVEKHKVNIMEKLGVSNTAELINKVIRDKLLS